MKRALAAAVTVALPIALSSVLVASPVHAHVPEVFGSDWDDPMTAMAPIDRPDTPSCEVELVDHVFADDEPFESTFVPDDECGTSWSKVVLDLAGEVEGRQHDRLATLEIDGVPVFKTSTPQPSPEGVEWNVERDLTGYSSLLTEERPVTMSMGNVTDAVHTGVFDIRVTLTFYAADGDNPAGNVADRVVRLDEAERDGADLTGNVTVPRNSTRLLADVYATASGGGCEEFWYMTAPPESQYPCEGDSGPYREVQILVDGQVAGIATPYPAVYAGGWSNPFLWYTLPAPRAFDLRPITYDLTPYLGLLNDGEDHEVTVRVVGAGSMQGWSTPTAFRVWQDADSRVVEGGVLMSKTTPLSNTSVVSKVGGKTEAATVAGHQHTATGWLETSRGRILTTVDRVLSYTGTHTFGPDANPDMLEAELSDVESRTVLGPSSTSESHETTRLYRLEGHKNLDEDGRLSTKIDLNDRMSTLTTSGRSMPRMVTVDHSHMGEASWDTQVPREERRAEGTSVSRYHVTFTVGGDERCYDRELRSANGYVTVDRHRC
ncbi:MAG TPA: peptide-N(4)-(N-acetyl-beta-glucosaminyl)asparagine amidase [Candidatus Stackebrandtia excrementipullorum]|nr:peptide-N(4)-(N-acetyl-beta-glucosaminyl)asparagine amidase [Candidatus Stackebrandtia excrementipullorum]